jgi:hypothetical protein
MEKLSFNLEEARKRSRERLEMLIRENGTQPYTTLDEFLPDLPEPPPDEPDLFETIMELRREWRGARP